MTDLAGVRETVTSVIAPTGLECYDVQMTGTGRARTLRVLVTRPGGVDLDEIADVARLLSPALDAADPPPAGPYVLEVSSPGVERPLRSAAHFAGAIGETVSVRHEAADGARRLRGVLRACDDDRLVLEVDGTEVSVDRSEVTAARTVFEWGTPPRPGRGSRPGKSATRRAKEKARS